MITNEKKSQTTVKEDPHPSQDSPEHESMALLVRKRYGLASETRVWFFGSNLSPAGADFQKALSADKSAFQDAAVVICGGTLDSPQYLSDCLCKVTDAGATSVALHIEPGLFASTSREVFSLYRQARPDMVKHRFLVAA